MKRCDIELCIMQEYIIFKIIKSYVIFIYASSIYVKQNLFHVIARLAVKGKVLYNG